MIESGNTISSLHRVKGLRRVKVADYLGLWQHYGDDCVIFRSAGQAFYAACGDRSPILVAKGGQGLGPEGVVTEREFFVRDGAPWRKREIVPIEDIKKRAAVAGPYQASWRVEADRSEPVPQVHIEKRFGLDERDEYPGRTPLMRLVMQNDAEQVNALIRAGADVSVRDNYGYSALILAAADGQDDIVRLLIRAGADLNVQPNPGDTPLARAILGSHAEAALMLIEAGANVKLKMSDGDTPLLLARQLELNRVVEALERAGAKE